MTAQALSLRGTFAEFKGFSLLKLSPIDSPHLIWPHVEAALNRVIAKTGERWTPPFVLGRILSGQAGLFRFTDDGEHKGWLVVERMEQGQAPYMNVWILEGEGLEHSKQAIALIDALAGNVGCKAWRLTGRKGWGKVLGLDPIGYVFERVCT